MNQRNENLGNSIFVHFEITFFTTLTGILDFANLIFQTGIFSQFKLGKKIKLDISNWRKSKIPKIQVQIDRRCVLHYRVFEYDVQDFALRKFYYCVTQCHFVTVVITFRCTTIFLIIEFCQEEVVQSPLQNTNIGSFIILKEEFSLVIFEKVSKVINTNTFC